MGSNSVPPSLTRGAGGNSGIGPGFARGVAKMGGDVVIRARNEEKNAEAKKDLLDCGARRVETYQVDVTSEEQIVAGYDRLIADMGRVDCVFANSGGSAKQHALLDMPTEEWRDLFNLNLNLNLNTHGVDDVRLDPYQRPEPGPNDVVIRMKAVGICGSDLSCIKLGGINRQPDGVIALGHEGALEVKKAALAQLLHMSGGSNLSETMGLMAEIGDVEGRLTATQDEVSVAGK